MAAILSNQSINKVKRGLSIASGHVMSALVNNLRTKLIGAILAGVLAPQAAVAGPGCFSKGHCVLRSGDHAATRSFDRTSVAARPHNTVASKKPVTNGSASFVNRFFAASDPAVTPVAAPETATVKTAAVQTALIQTAPAQVPTVGTTLAANPANTLTTIAGNVDLVLEDVELVERGTISAGPAFRVKFRNQGTHAAGKFRVGAFAENGGELHDDAPQAVCEVASLAAGATSEVTLRLPVPVIRLVSTSASPSAFDQLVVVVDLDDTVVESQKSNNVANLDRDQLESSAR